jgi:phage-related baseplate assembly protein
VLSQTSQGYLTNASSTLKNNLRTYLSQYRMIGDTIEIRDAYIINIGINFDIITYPNYNNNEVLLKCINELVSHFNTNQWQINQPIMMRELYGLLDKVQGVQTVKSISIENKVGTSLGYSPYSYDIESATQNMVIYPSLDPSIFELRYPSSDIKGRVSQF